MGKARSIDLDTITFKKAGDATEFFRTMLKRYENGARVSQDDDKHLRALLKRHDERAEKEGVGISHFYVDVSPEHSTRCFWIYRSDDTQADFSFMHCLQKKPGD